MVEASPQVQGRTVPLFQARTIAVGSALVAAACALAIVPIAAFGDARGPTSSPTPEVAELLEVAEQVQDVNELARDDAPNAVGGACGDTMEVEGIGDACVTRDGLLRVEQADGRSHTIHGLDAPPVSAAAFTPTSQAAVSSADASDISCTADGTQRYVLVYARPGNVASRMTTIAPLLRSEIYKMSAFIDSESRGADPSAGRRLPLRCDGSGAPVVLEAALSTLTAGTATFGGIVDAMRAQGYEFNGSGSGAERYIVYYDAPSPSGAAGTGHVFTTDSSAGAANQNNKGGLYAVEYRFDQGGAVPHWEVLIHEVLHTMGAVVSNAAHATPSGHCTDGQDVMCYDDGSGSGFSASTCGTKALDCNRDDYFNPAPAAGSFLATHWNAAATYNSWLASHAGGALPADASGLVQTGASDSAVSISWKSVANAAGASVSVRDPGGAWREVTSTTRTAATISGLAASSTYEVGVAIRTAAGTIGERATITVSTNDQPDLVAPSSPGRVVAKHQGAAVNFTWTDGGDNVGVATFELREVNASGRSLRSAGTTADTTLSIPASGLKPGVRYRFEVVAHDGAANVSPAASVTVQLTKDRARPTAPSAPRATTVHRTSLVLRWNASRDDAGVKDYVVYQQIGSRWRVLGRPIAASVRAVRIVGLRGRTSYVFRVHARDSAGNVSNASRTLRTRTR